MKRKLQIGLILAASMAVTPTFAQETVLASSEAKTETTPATEEDKKEKDEPTFTLSGSIDTYGRTAFGTSTISGYEEDGTPIFSPAPNTSFANLKGFGLGMANLIASYGGDKAGFTADLVFGPRGTAAVFGDGALYAGSGQRIINQMFAYVKVGKATFNLGQFNTFLGYEVISPAVNFHYSTSYLFSWGPFNHTGARVDFAFDNGLVAKLAIMNPTDIVEFNPVNTYTLGGQFGYTNEKGGIWLNVLAGDQDGKLTDDNSGPLDSSLGLLTQFDITTGWNLGEKFYLGANVSTQSLAAGQAVTAGGEVEDADGDASSFFGVAVYPKLTLSESFAIGARAEYFSISKGHLGIIDLDDEGNGSVTAITISGNYKIGGLTLIPEFRMDSAKDSFFKNEDLTDPKGSMSSLTLAAVYKF